MSGGKEDQIYISYYTSQHHRYRLDIQMEMSGKTVSIRVKSSREKLVWQLPDYLGAQLLHVCDVIEFLACFVQRIVEC